jgi:hypothetical protein
MKTQSKGSDGELSHCLNMFCSGCFREVEDVSFLVEARFRDLGTQRNSNFQFPVTKVNVIT